MNYYLDTAYEYQKSKNRMLISSLFFALLFSIVLISDVFLVFKAGQDYRLNLIVSIIISVLFIWFSIYFFTTTYQEINKRYRFFKNFGSGIKEQQEVEYIKCSDDLNYINGLYVYPIHVFYQYGLEQIEKVIYCQTKLNYVQGDKLTIQTYQRILIEAEIHQ